MLKDLSKEDLDKAYLVYVELYHQSYINLHKEQIEYPSDEDLKDKQTLTHKDRKEALFKFQEEGAIKINDEIGYGRYNTPYKWFVEIINPNFGLLEDKLKKLWLKLHEDNLNATIGTKRPFRRDWKMEEKNGKVIAIYNNRDYILLDHIGSKRHKYLKFLYDNPGYHSYGEIFLAINNKYPEFKKSPAHHKLKRNLELLFETFKEKKYSFINYKKEPAGFSLE